MANEATPRVNAPYLESFTNQTVRIVGKVVALHGETATLDAAGEVQIILNRVGFLMASLFFVSGEVEVWIARRRPPPPPSLSL